MPQAIPIVAGIAGAAIGGAIGSAIGGTVILGLTTAAIGAQIGAAVLGFAGNLLAAELMDEPAGRSSRESQQAIREGAAERFMGFGTVKVAADAHPVFDTNAEGDFLRLMALNHGPIDSFVSHEVNGETVSLDGSNLVTGSTDGRFDGLIYIEEFDGASDQAALAQAVSDYDGWTSDHRLRGIAGVYVRQKPVGVRDSRARWANSAVPYKATIKAASDIYDPRDGSTGWSDNAALVLLWYLRHPDGRNLDDDRIDFDSFAAAADICDEEVPLKGGGTERRYRACGQVGLEQEPRAIVRAMLKNMDGALYTDSEGKQAVQIGNPASARTLTDRHVIASDFQARARLLDRYNRVVARITSEAHGYQEITTPAQEDADDIAAHGARTFEMELPFCPSPTQAQRLQKKKLLELNASERGTLVTNLAGLPARPGSVLTLDYDAAETDLPLKVLRRSIQPNHTEVELEVISIDPAYDEWDAATDEQDLAALPAVGSSGGILAKPQNVVAVGAGIETSSGGFSAAIRVSFDPPETVGGVAVSNPGDVLAEVEISNANADAWWGQVDAAGDAGFVYSPPLESGSDYDVRVRFRGPGGGATDWVTVEDVTAQAQTSTLSAPTISASSPLAGMAQVSGEAPGESGVRAVSIYENTADDFSTASLVATVYLDRGEAFTRQFSRPSGTYYYWGTTVNASGIEGPESPSDSVVI